MNKLSHCTAVLAALSAAPAVAQSDPGLSPEVNVLANELGRCIVSKTTGEDRIAVAGWMLAALASAPQLKGVAEVAPARKDAADRGMARTYTRLIAKDCESQSRALFATRKPEAFGAASRPLGEIAMRELMSDPATMAALAAYANYLDNDDFKDVIPSP
jgi:hypothetical protein